ncbi:unnamed protein product [Arabis nemorensis]|uniref:Uncharacterized protein n=1 Tax=Arabis nemorensis TaxID=586526 RepID=A0A565C5I6_9BRAS|nr:unnamed protein product [Arabis nemorensis]
MCKSAFSVEVFTDKGDGESSAGSRVQVNGVALLGFVLRLPSLSPVDVAGNCQPSLLLVSGPSSHQSKSGDGLCYTSC